jgi:hypothetical protein
MKAGSSGFLGKFSPLVCENEGLLTRRGALFSAAVRRLHRANEDRGPTDAHERNGKKENKLLTSFFFSFLCVKS